MNKSIQKRSEIYQKEIWSKEMEHSDNLHEESVGTGDLKIKPLSLSFLKFHSNVVFSKKNRNVELFLCVCEIGIVGIVWKPHRMLAHLINITNKSVLKLHWHKFDNSDFYEKVDTTGHAKFVTIIKGRGQLHLFISFLKVNCSVDGLNKSPSNFSLIIKHKEHL